MSRMIPFSSAVLEATEQCMAADPSVYIMGLGVPDPKGVFGTTLSLQDKFGSGRVLDMPVAENGMTGIAIGSALAGMRPIITHQRIDFMLLSLDQIINNAAKWHYMFGGAMKVPLVIRLIIGMGWGQGPQHSQALQAIFAHIPGLKVVMPFSPYDAKGLLVSAIEDDNPVIYIEHRWLHSITGHVPEDLYREPIGKARVAREGSDVTIVSSSQMTLEALKAAEKLAQEGIRAEVLDLRSLRPFDEATVLESVRKTGRLVVAENAWPMAGFSAEVVSMVAQKAYDRLQCAPARITFPDVPSPTSPALAKHFYPNFVTIVNVVGEMFNLRKKSERELGIEPGVHADVPNKLFTGPF